MADWPAFERQIFKKLIDRTKFVFEIREFRRSNTVLKQDFIQIACVSPEFTVGDIGAATELALAKFRDDCTLLRATERHDPIRWETERFSELQHALETKPDIICFSELAYPPPLPTDTDWTVEVLRSSIVRKLEFEKRVRDELMRWKSRAFLFLGSYHCLTTLYSVGVLFPWGPSFDPVDVYIHGERLGSNVPSQTTQIVPPIIYRKRFPARRVGEDTRVPSGQELNIFTREFGRVSLLICSDIVDLNQFLAVARRNRLTQKYDPIDILLIPSYNESRHLPLMCRELSSVAATTVVLVNANHLQTSFPKTDVFCCGLAIDDLNALQRGETPLVTANVSTVSHSNGRRSTLTTFSLNAPGVAKLRNELLMYLLRSETEHPLPENNITRAQI